MGLRTISAAGVAGVDRRPLLLLRDHRAIAFIVVVAIATYGWTYATRERVFALYKGEAIYPQTIAWAEKRLPRDGVVAAMQLSGSFFYYTGRFTLRYDLIAPADLAKLPRPVYAVVFDWEEPKLPGHWTRLDHTRGASLMKLDDVLSEVKPEHGAGDQR